MRDLILKGARAINRAITYNGPKVAFIHIPKCGGSSLKNSLSRKLDPFSRYKFKYEHAQKAASLTSDRKLLNTGITDDFEQLKFLLCYHLNSNYRFVHGHFPVTDEILNHYKSRYHFVTLLRDPLERWKSNYLFNKGLPDPDSIRVPSKNFKGTLEDEFAHVIDSGTGLLMGSLTTSFLAGRYPSNNTDSLALCETAISNLQLFDEVGTLDNLDLFTHRLSKLTSKTLSIRTDNGTENLYSGQNSDIYEQTKEFLNRDEVTRTIKTLTKADQFLYESIKTKQSS